MEFDRFVAELEPRLMSYLAHACRDRTEAEDLFQEVCLRVHREWGAVRGMDRPDGWAFRVAHNLMVNRSRRRGIERRALSALGRGAARPDRTPDEATGRREAEVAVAEAIRTLPEDQRQAVCLKIHGERSWVEIGRILGVSDDTAARLFARGLRALAGRLEGYAGGSSS